MATRRILKVPGMEGVALWKNRPGGQVFVRVLGGRYHGSRILVDVDCCGMTTTVPIGDLQACWYSQEQLQWLPLRPAGDACGTQAEAA